MLQPIGRTLAIDVTPTVGFYPLETVINGQVAMPNHIKINGKDNNGLVQLVLNDALLRTPDDRVFLDIDNRDGGAFDLAVYIGTREAAKLAYAAEPLESHLARVVRQQVGAGAVMVLVLSQIDGHFIAELDGSNMGNSNEDDSSSDNNAPSSDNSGIVWDELVNCTYNNGELVWDGKGVLRGENGYAAKTLNAPNSFSLQCNKVKYVSFFIGEEVDLTTLKTTGEGVYFSMYAVDDDYDYYRLTHHPQGHTGSTVYNVPLGFLPDDKLVWQISQSVLTITSLRTNEQIIIQNENIRPNSPLALVVESGNNHVENFAIAPYTDPLPTDVVTVIYE